MPLINLIGLATLGLLLLEKWKILPYYEATRRPWMPAANCALCLGFWIAVLIQIVTFGNIGLAFVAAPFIQLIINLTKNAGYSDNTDRPDNDL